MILIKITYNFPLVLNLIIQAEDQQFLIAQLRLNTDQACEVGHSMHNKSLIPHINISTCLMALEQTLPAFQEYIYMVGQRRIFPSKEYTHQRCVGDMVTKNTRFFRGLSLEATQLAQALIANSMAPRPSNSSQTPFSSELHLQKSCSYSYNYL